jgi:hypothetical protein
MTSLERFELPKPISCGEHAECSHLISFLEQYVDEVLVGKTTIDALKCDLELAKLELEESLGPCIDLWNEQHPF